MSSGFPESLNTFGPSISLLCLKHKVSEELIWETSKCQISLKGNNEEEE